MIKIGLFGESPYDTTAIKELLSRIYPGKFEFIIMLPRLRGGMLDNKMIIIDLKIEYSTQKPDFVIVVRDLDAFLSDSTKTKQLNDFFDRSNKAVEGMGLFLLNVYELEALILADIDCFNKFYNVNATYDGIPTDEPEPKELLKSFTIKNKNSKKYTPGHCPAIFRLIDYDKIRSTCFYFKDFLIDLEIITDI